MRFSEAVYEAVRKIPKGKVSTYQEVARAAGNPKAVRAVGQVLKRNPHKDVPCHRVVMSSGRPGGFRGNQERKKRRMLESEGVRFAGNKVVMERHFWKFRKRIL